MKLTWRQKKKKKEMCRKRDGDICLVDYCMTGDEYREKHGKDFDLHHIDENEENNSDDNLCLATHACNSRETPRGKGKFNHERIGETFKSMNLKGKRSVSNKGISIDDSGLRISFLSELKNKLLKPIAEKEFKRIMEKDREIEKESLIDAMANISGLTQQSCRNYMKAFINPHNGEFEEFPKEIDGENRKYIKRRSK